MKGYALFSLAVLVLTMETAPGLRAESGEFPETAAAVSPDRVLPASQTLGPSQVAAFEEVLSRWGYTVQEGRLEKINLIDLYCAGLTPDCAANNAGSLYLTYHIPPAPGAAPPHPLPWLFQLAPGEAIVLVGQTPPPVAYFSYQTFLHQRFYEDQSAYRRIYAPLGDTVNNMTIQVGAPRGITFGRGVLLVTTADRAMRSRIYHAARRAGLPSAGMNTEVIPSALVRMGNEPGCDLLVFAHRLFLPAPGYKQAVTEYMTRGQTVLRVTPPSPERSLDPYPAPSLRVRGTGRTEMGLMPVMEELRNAILERYREYEATELITSVWLPDGYDGLQTGTDVLGPTRDALYLRTRPDFTLLDSPDDFVIVYGVNHQRTGKALYSNFVLYISEDAKMGIGGENSPNFPGSALPYLPGREDADSFYVWKISRRCTGEPNCLTVAMDSCPRLALDDSTECWVGFRVYAEPATKVGPAFTEVVYDRAIKFTRR